MSKSATAYIRVECDNCHDTIEVELTAIANHGYDERYVDKELQRLGWRDEGDDIHICDGCQEEYDEGE